MCTSKKVAIAVGAVLAGVLLLGTPIGSFAWNKGHTAVSHVFNWCDSQVTPEEDLKSLKADMDKIDKDIKKHISALAKMEVEVEQLDKRVADLRNDQDRRKSDLEAMTKLLEGKTEPRLSFQNITYRPSDLLSQVQKETTTYKIKKSELESLQDSLQMRRAGLEMANRKISEMRTQKGQLETAHAELRMQVDRIKLKQVTNKVDTDDTQVNSCWKRVNAIKTKLRVQETELELLQKNGYGGTTPVFEQDVKNKDEILNAARKAIENNEPAAVAVEK